MWAFAHGEGGEPQGGLFVCPASQGRGRHHIACVSRALWAQNSRLQAQEQGLAGVFSAVGKEHRGAHGFQVSAVQSGLEGCDGCGVPGREAELGQALLKTPGARPGPIIAQGPRRGEGFLSAAEIRPWQAIRFGGRSCTGGAE